MSKIEKVQKRIKIITGVAMLMLLVGILALLSTATELTYMGISGLRFLLIFCNGYRPYIWRSSYNIFFR